MRPAGLFLAALVIALCGCGAVSLHNNSIDVALYQSEDQRLVVTNTTTKPLTIVGPSGKGTVALAPGQSMVIAFRVATIGTADPPSGTPYWRIDPAGFTERFLEVRSPGLVDTSSPALALNFHDPDGVLVKASFGLTGCGPNGGWARQKTPPADHAIQVPDPVPAVPQAVCP